ncbi:flagellar assembly protein FliH [Alcaligenes sp. SDU_A2]|uniref:flagellar assembly protein FliH n=1 Tax=Alcaligenes sp. SDU_A2 TaxID=3136634 RepID=UPI00311E2D40
MSGHPKGASAYADLQESWSRWQMQGLDEPAPQPEPVEPEFEPPSEQELQQQLDELRAQAQAQGHQEGYQAGHEQGHAAGLAAGQESGHAQGYEAGMAAGLAQAQEQIAEHAQAFIAINHACSQSIETLDQEIGQALIGLATRIAEHVLRSTLNEQPERIKDLVADVLRADPGDTSALLLSLHPDDIALVREYLSEEAEQRPWRLQPDATLQRGDCIVRSAYGDIDATLATRWQRALSALGLKPDQKD